MRRLRVFPVMRRTPPERSGTAICPRAPDGRLLPLDPLARFAAKCEFDATTGCVLWRGGVTSGRGNSALYGSFWFEGRRWTAHRWAGVHIHGLDLDGVQGGHCCPHGPNTLCVEHIEPQTIAENVTERNVRAAAVRRVEQSSLERQHWLFVGLGMAEPPEAPAIEPDLPPFYEPPAWLRPFLVDRAVNLAQQCPF